MDNTIRPGHSQPREETHPHADAPPIGGTLTHRRVESNGLTFHVVEAGPVDGPLVVLLHGFPEFWLAWRYQIPALAGAGYRVWAPDQRGYNLSDKPRGVAAYAIDHLARDVVGLIRAAGQARAVVVGHDWGAAVSWHLAAHHADCVEKLIVMNVPHGQVLTHHLRHNPRQLLRSWYMLFFQLPWLPERVLRRRDWAWLAGTLCTSSRPGTFTTADIDAYKRAWSRPGALTAMVNWYRAGFRTSGAPPAEELIRVPTLLLWGARDRFLGAEMAQPSIDRCDQGRLVLYDNATHWLHHEIPDAVNAAIVDFVGDQVESLES